jgi:GNAT superfamily N-acetyltransferase
MAPLPLHDKKFEKNMIEIIEADLAVAGQADAFISLLDAYARDQSGGGEPLSAFAKANLAAELHKRAAMHVILAFVDRVPAGLLVCIEGFSTFACKPLLNIHDVMVLAEYRGKGLFRLMLQKTEEIASAAGCCKITLEVLEGNHIAQAVYRAAGFAGYELDPTMGKAMFWQKKL